MIDTEKEIELTSNSDLVFESFHAREEGNAWRNLALKDIHDDYTSRQAYILLILSTELYIKSLLMVLDVDVISTFKTNDGHNLSKLYNALPDKNLKQTILENVKFHPVGSKYPTNPKNLDTFNDYLTEISKGFINYRYEYEKYVNNEDIFMPSEFIYNLNYILNAICNNLEYEAIYPAGEITVPQKASVHFLNADNNHFIISP